MAFRGWDAPGIVVHISPGIGPGGVLYEHDREWMLLPTRKFLDADEVVAHSIVIQITFEEHRIDWDGDPRQSCCALFRIQSNSRGSGENPMQCWGHNGLDLYQAGAERLAVLKKESGVVTSGGANLQQVLSLQLTQHWPDDINPKEAEPRCSVHCAQEKK